MASPGIGPNGPHEQEEPEIGQSAAAGGSSNPAEQFAEQIGSTGPRAEVQPEDNIGPNGPHLTGE